MEPGSEQREELSTLLTCTHLITPPPTTPPSTTKAKLSRSSAIDEEQQLLDFLRETMLKSVKDRNIILRIETDLVQFVKERGRSNLPFPSMSSYHRMLVHRISALFNLDHNIDPIANCVVVSKNGAEKLIDFRFRELLENKSNVGADGGSDGPRLLRREREGQQRSSERVEKQQSTTSKKTFEQRSLDYHRARHRIFQQPHLKVESFDERRTRPSNGSQKFGKSRSFGGYGEAGPSSSISNYNQSSSISPASSGYKSLQIMSTSTSCSSSQDYFIEEQQDYGQLGGPVQQGQQQQVQLQQQQLPILQQQQLYPQPPIYQQYPYLPPPQQQNIIYYVPITQQQLLQVQRFGSLLPAGQQIQGQDPYWQQVQQQQIQQQQVQLQQVQLQQQQIQQVQMQQQQQYYQPLHLPPPQQPHYNPRYRFK